jgi:putative transposase
MAHSQWRQVADQLNPRWAKLAALMDQAEADVLALMSFPKHTGNSHSTNPRERLNGGITRRTQIVRIFPTRPPLPVSSPHYHSARAE